MGRSPCCEKTGLKRGKWTEEEDETLIKYIKTNGEGSWRSLPKNAGLLRCGKSCRLRWINYLRTDLKRGNFTTGEEETIVKLHRSLGNRWSLIASHLPGRTDNEIKNYWNSHLSRRIYSFRSIANSQPPFSPADIINMANTAKKKPAGRAIAKNHNKSTKPTQKQALAQEPSVGQARTGHGGDPDHPICTGQQNAKAKGEGILPRTGPGHMATDGCYGSNCGKEVEWGPFPQQTKKSSLLSSCDDPPPHAGPKGGGWAHNTLMALPKDPSDHYVEVLGPLWEEVDEETLMNLKQLLEERYVMGQEESIPTIDDDATDNSIVLTNKGDSATTSEEKDYTEIESLYAYSSPLASYFEEQAFSWNQVGGAFGEIGSGIWSEEEEDIRIWS